MPNRFALSLIGIMVFGRNVSAAAPLGDPIRGERIHQRCMACHALAYHRTGPRHCGLLGRRAGSLPGYAYSDAMRNSGIVWTATTLNEFLTAPTRYVRGTTMGYAGIDDPVERRDLIAYLTAVSGDATLCPVREREE